MSMAPDRVPRKVMGGGFRSHSPPRSSTNKALLQKQGERSRGSAGDRDGVLGTIVGMGNQLRPHIPSSTILHSRHATPSRSGIAAKDGAKGQVENLEQQMKDLQLELHNTKHGVAPSPRYVRSGANSRAGSSVTGSTEAQQADGSVSDRDQRGSFSSGQHQTLQAAPRSSLAAADAPMYPVDDDLNLSALANSLRAKTSELQRNHDRLVDEAQQREEEAKVEGKVREEESRAQAEALERERRERREEVAKMGKRVEEARLKVLQIEGEKRKLEILLESSEAEAKAVTAERNSSIEKECKLEEKLSIAESDVRRLQADVAAVQERLQAERGASAKARGEAAALRDELRRGAGGVSAEEAQKLRKEAEEMRALLEEEKDKVGRLRVSLQAFEDEVKGQVESKASLERRLYETEDKLKMVEGRKSDEDYKGRMESAEARLAQAMEDVAAARRAERERELAEADARRELVRVKAVNVQLESDSRVYKEMLANSGSEVEASAGLLSKAVADCSKAEAECERLRGRLDEALAEKGSVEKAHASCMSEIQKLKVKVEVAKVGEFVQEADLGTLVEANQQVASNITALIESLKVARSQAE